MRVNFVSNMVIDFEIMQIFENKRDMMKSEWHKLQSLIRAKVNIIDKMEV